MMVAAWNCISLLWIFRGSTRLMENEVEPTSKLAFNRHDSSSQSTSVPVEEPYRPIQKNGSRISILRSQNGLAICYCILFKVELLFSFLDFISDTPCSNQLFPQPLPKLSVFNPLVASPPSDGNFSLICQCQFRTSIGF